MAFQLKYPKLKLFALTIILAYIIFKGGTGTVSEFGTAWALAKLYYPHHKPFILYGKFWYKIIEAIKGNMEIRKEAFKVFKIVETKEEVLQVLLEFDQEMVGYDHRHCRICKDKAFMN